MNTVDAMAELLRVARERAVPKLGALDDLTRHRLGLLGPLVAPVLPDGLHTGVFGHPVEPVDQVQVTVRHDGATVGQGSGAWAEAAGRVSLLPSWLAPRVHVATGSITAMIPAAAGSWEFDFGVVGTIVLDLA
jgi:hypothetical protein